MSRIGKKAVADPRRRHRDARRPDGHRQRPQGPARLDRGRRDRGQPGGRRADASRRATTASARAAMWGLSRTLVANMVAGRHPGLRGDAGAGRRRLSRGDEGPGALACSSASPTTSTSRRRTASPSPRRKQTEIKISRHRQAAGRRDRRPHPQHPPARALQGQGRALRRREGPPQGRQEEVSHGALSLANPPSAAPSASALA